VQFDIELARKQAYAPYVPTETDESNFRFYTQCATGTYVGTFNDGRTYTSKIEGKELEQAKANIVDGYTGYLARCHQERIASFERRVKEGYFEPGVVTWCGRIDLAMTQKSQRLGHPQYALVEIVPAEVVQPKAKKAELEDHDDELAGIRSVADRI